MTAKQRIGRIRSLILINEFNNELAELVYKHNLDGEKIFTDLSNTYRYMADVFKNTGNDVNKLSLEEAIKTLKKDMKERGNE